MPVTYAHFASDTNDAFLKQFTCYKAFAGMMSVKFNVKALHIFTVMATVVAIPAQTEGDTGYDYNDAYEESYDESSGQLVTVH